MSLKLPNEMNCPDQLVIIVKIRILLLFCTDGMALMNQLHLYHNWGNWNVNYTAIP